MVDPSQALWGAAVPLLAWTWCQRQRRRSQRLHYANCSNSVELGNEPARRRDAVNVRRARPEEMDTVFEMILALATFESCLERVGTNEAQLRMDLLAGKFECVVAEYKSDGRLAGAKESSLIGFAFFSWGYSTWVGKTVLLDDLFVSLLTVAWE